MSQAASIVSAPIWHQYMQEVTKDDPNDKFTQPSGIKQVTIDANTGKAPTDATKKTRTDIFPSWYNIPKADSAQNATIDTVSGKLATDCTPEAAKKQITGALITAEVAPTDPAFNRWNPPVQALARSLGYDSGGAIPTDKDNVHDCGDAKPQIGLSVSPSTGSVFTITAGITSGRYPATQVTYYRDGAVLTTQSISGSTTTSITDTPPAGNHTYSAVVQDSALYTGSSNSVSVTATSPLSYSLNCSSHACSLIGATSGTIATLFVGGASKGAQSSGYTWAWGSPAWNGSSGISSNVYASVSGQNVYP